MLDLHRLLLLRELEARGTLLAVARALDYTPSAVSQGLAVLAREAGTELLQPAGRGVVLTDAGRLLARHADRLLAGVETAEAELAAASGRVAGTVRIAGFQSATLVLALPAAAALATTLPDVRVEVVEAELEETLPALRLGGYDVVLGDEYEGLPRPRARGLTRELLLREELLLVLPATHPQARRPRADLTLLADAAWAVSHPGTGHHEMVVGVCRATGGFEPDVRHLSTDVVVLLECVRRTGALTFLPRLALPAGPDPHVRPRPLASGARHREVFALTRDGSAARPAVAAVLAALREQAARRTA